MLWCVLYPEGVFYHVVGCFVTYGGVLSCCDVLCNLRGCFIMLWGVL